MFFFLDFFDIFLRLFRSGPRARHIDNRHFRYLAVMTKLLGHLEIIFSVFSQEICSEKRPRNGLFYVQRDLSQPAQTYDVVTHEAALDLRPSPSYDPGAVGLCGDDGEVFDGPDRRVSSL